MNVFSHTFPSLAYTSIPEVLEARADRNPDRAAVLALDRNPFSFRRLFLQAQEVVERLNSMGIGRGDRVAAVLPNGPEMAAAFLTISSTAAFAPLNPAYRAAEFDFFLSDLMPRALVIPLGMDSPARLIAQRHSIPIVELLPSEEAEAGYFALKEQARSRPICDGFAEANDIALILHTSGTTSRPKMVPLTHSNLLASAGNIAAGLRLTEADRCLSVMPLFHIHGLIGAILSSLVAGSSVICTGEFNAPEVLDWLEKFRPTWYTAVPTMHQAIAARAKDSARTLGRFSLRFIRSCSAPLPPRVLMELEELFQVPVIEAYGMTEGSHQIASNPLPPNPRKVGSVGPATGTEIAILSETGEFLPSGPIGEIVIRGSNLMRGYEGDTAANAAAFANGWFRTGDLGYLDADGYLFITGRLKEIINRGGEKISPAEVDRVLTDHPAVAQAVTFAVPHGKLGEDVAAAVVLRAGVTAADRELREFAALRLAEYKVPRRVVIVDEIPKGATGKVQRLGLAARLGLEFPDAIEIAEAHGFVAPRSAVEEALAKFWSEVLRIDPVGIDDNFFDLGGDSILASQVIARVRHALGAELSFLDFFDAPRLAQMAERIDHCRRHSELDDRPLVPVARGGELPLSFAQQRIWFFDQLEPGSPLYNRPLFLRLRGRLDKLALQLSLNEVVRRHEVIRTSFSSVDGRPHQRVLPPSPMTVCTEDLRGLPDAVREVEARRLAVEESLRTFDLTADLLLRAKLLQLGDEEHILILTNHHIAFDGWSDGILFRELSALYKAHAAGLPSPLPELPIQYGDFAVWQRASLQERKLEASLDYWKRQLAGAPSGLDLPTDRPRPAARSYRGAMYSNPIVESLSNALRALSRREGVTLYMLLLAAFKLLLGRCSGQSDIVVGTPIAGRTHVETENLIGVFINTLVLRTDLSGDPSFRECLVRVRKVFLEADANSKVPIEKLTEVLQPARHMNFNPLFQVMFQLRNTPAQGLELPEVAVDEPHFANGLSKLDLTLEIVPEGDGFDCRFYYSVDLFEESTIARVAQQYQRLLEAIVDNPEGRLGEFAAVPNGARGLEPAAAFDAGGSAIYERSNLTGNQLLVWMGQKLHPEVPLYNLPCAFYLDGEIDRGHFEKAFRTLINSSDALRTVIREIDGVPQQCVLSNLAPEIEFRDFSSLPDAKTAVQDWLENRCRVPLKLDEAVFDCALAKVSGGQFVWFLNVHHIVVDGRSFELIFRTLSRLYACSLEGDLESRVALPAFQDYVEDEKASRRAPHFLEVEAFWKTKLAEPPDPVRFYGNSLVKRTTRAESISCELGRERTEKLKQIASRAEISAKTERASIFNIFAAALATFIYRVSGNRRLSIGAPFHNRRSKAFQNTIGLLMEAVPLRVVVKEDDTFVSLLRRIASEASAAFRQSHAIGNSFNHGAYDVLLNYNTISFPDFHGISVRAERLHTGHENLSLILRVRDYAGDGSLVVDFEFHHDAFDETQRDQAVRHFLNILDRCLENPHRALEDVKFLSEAETERILLEFSGSRRKRSDDSCLIRSLEDRLGEWLDRPAVVFETESLTYAQLNTRANRLAHYLRALGVKPGMFVGICAERCPETIVGVMGILKAGAAYVPLDPAYPRDRLDFMIRDTRMPVLLSQSPIAEKLPGHVAKVVCLDSDWGAISRMSEASPEPETTPDHPAYVIYTSGSTGRPKGVEITRGALANFIGAASEAFALGSGDRVLQFASMSFDASVEEIFTTLVRGATLVLRTDSMLDSVAVFLERCRDWRITVLDLPTAYWHELTEALSRERLQLPECVRLVIIGGERVVPDRVSLWRKLTGDRVRLLNGYGPTEATVVATMRDITGWKSERGASAEVPIGRPISNVQTYILDGRLNPVPIGVCGELYVGGAGLARGYLNRPDLTAVNFIPNPFSGLPGMRLYRTGDRARYLSEGDLEFLGRVDQQLKIRGFRIEPGEIEAALRHHPSVRDAAVAASETAAGERQLVAYLVPGGGGCPPVSELRQLLQKELPGYMIPTIYMELQSLPLTVNGKIDREALPAPGPNRPMQKNTFVSPATAEEERIAAIWADVLRLNRVGVQDNFFDLGGHSLLAIQVVSRVRDAFKMDLPLRALFDHPTVAGLAIEISEAQAKRPEAKPMDEILADVESLSDEEAQRLVDENRTSHKG